MYVCPKTKKPLWVSGQGDESVTKGGIAYPLLNIGKGIPDFLSAYSLSDLQKINLDIYNQSFSVERYRNELDWLYATFGEDESSFRRQNLKKLEIRRGQSMVNSTPKYNSTCR